MKRILIYKQIISNGEYDIEHLTDYNLFKDTILKYYKGECPNIGNKLWLEGIVTELSDGENEIVFLSNDMNTEYINLTFDCIVLPMANIFYVGYIEAIKKLTSVFENIRIPTYVIACGVQADSYDKLNETVDILREPATRFIKAIYNTGGEFALRGYFTKEFFDKLGFTTAVVTGCPSLYQLGPDFIINKPNISSEELKPSFNGSIEIVQNYLDKYPNSIYVDQCDYYEILSLSKIDDSRTDRRYLNELAKKYGVNILKLAREGRIKLFPDMLIWKEFLIQNGYNFSFGSRIHGSVLPILSGVPAVLCPLDSRTREMAEFFHIPIENSNLKQKNLYEIYLNADYTEFNKMFNINYNKFFDFLKKNQLIKSDNIHNKYLYSDSIINNPQGIYSKYWNELGKNFDKMENKLRRYETKRKLIVECKKLIKSTISNK